METGTERGALKPEWLRCSLPKGKNYSNIIYTMKRFRLNTVCESARCPNRAECYSHSSLTFMILGDVCTRSCGYCAVRTGSPGSVDTGEPERVADAIKYLGLGYAVITSVTRDDLADRGASIFAETVKRIKEKNNATVEVLVPDFDGDKDLIKKVTDSKPDVFGHNIELVERLFRKLKPKADYQKSLGVLRAVKGLNRNMPIKSGFMLGLGETQDEIIQLMKELREAGCGYLTIGQYLKPADGRADVVRYYSPEEFKRLREIALDMGFKSVASGPLVRSSYNAEKMFLGCV